MNDNLASQNVNIIPYNSAKKPFLSLKSKSYNHKGGFEKKTFEKTLINLRISNESGQHALINKTKVEDFDKYSSEIVELPVSPKMG